METKEKVIALYKYIKELCALKDRTVTDVDKQLWTRYLKDIPNDPENIAIYYRDRVEKETDDNDDDDTVLLSVKKPEFQRCPEPPDIFKTWLDPSWDHYENEAKVKNTLSDHISKDTDKEPPEQFSDSTQRVHAFEKWVIQRNAWAEKQHIINRTRQFFTQLFEKYTDLERDLETLELMVGNGIVRETGNEAINHPLLLKRIKMQFDAKANVISIHDADTEPELYTLLLQEMKGIDQSAVKQISEDLHENYYHPLDRNDSPDFLKILTHRLCPDSKFIADEKDSISGGDRLVTILNPVFFIRKRIGGTIKTIEDIIKNIEDTDYVPSHLRDLVAGGIVDIPENGYEPTIDEQLAALNGESQPILLSKEANREQLEIAERIEHYNAVLVQGPPGTGKTHTIANLLGHFLAQGKNVLITSQTKKALSVLKEKVEDEIKYLCVSVLDDTNKDMVRSVDGISEYMSRHTANEIKNRKNSETRQRMAIINQLAEVRKRIYTIKNKEFKPIVLNGDSYSPLDAAKFVYTNAEKLSYIPGKVKLYHPLPLTVAQLIQLYRSNAGLTQEEEQELACDIPSPERLLSPSEFEKDLHQVTESKLHIAKIASELNYKIDIQTDKKTAVTNRGNTLVVLIQNPTADAMEQLKQCVNTFKDIDEWMIYAAADGRRGGGYHQRWETLINTIKDAAAYADSIVTQMTGKNIEITPEATAIQLPLYLQKLIEIFKKKGKVSKLDLFFNKPLETLLSGVKINGAPIMSENDCNLVQCYLMLKEKRNQAAMLWDELMAKHGVPEFFSLDDEPERIGLQIIPNIERYLNWYQNEYLKLLQFVKHAGLNSEAIFCESAMDSELIRTEKMLCTAHKILPLYIDLTDQLMILCGIEKRKKQTMQILFEGEHKSSFLCNSLSNAIKNGEAEVYGHCYRQLSKLYDKYSLKASREELLALIEPVAPEWANAIRNRIGIHGAMSCPQTIEEAWKWKQFAEIIDSITSEPFEELLDRSVMLSKELRKITAKVAADSAWYHLMLRTERNLSMRQALMGWKLTIKQIGKGTGKNAPMLKKRARELMAECQSAVPAWIMTVDKAMESLDPARNSFDVIIIDEASQSDISSLGIVYMAKKIIVVGDDKQVSPMAVGVDIDKINALRDMHIKNVIPNWQSYNAKTSLYDIVGTTFQPLMLREHFRCLPEIIGYSNKLSYEYKIKPLRNASSSVLFPPVVPFRVDDGIRESWKKINTKEAQTIVALMKSCMEQKEYDGMTFGIISLLGDEQARKIQQIILQKIDPVIIEQRQILCGNASHFQGDERDVIFLSLVDSNEGDGPLRKTGEGADQSMKQRYNVAASRARDQLWVVHSLDYKKDLKEGDLRRDLLEYADNPKAYAQLEEKIEKEAESPFEVAIGKALLASGYNIKQQWKVGSYRIDIVVVYKGNSVAVECDGMASHSGDEKIRADMERQAVLERIGWRFIRIRGSEYYRNPDKTMERVKCELSTYGIFPESTLDKPAAQSESELLDRVKIRAAQILDEWNTENNGTVTDITDKTGIFVMPKPESLMSTKEEDKIFEQIAFTPTLPSIELQKNAQEKREFTTTKRTEKLPLISVIKENQEIHASPRKPIPSRGNSLVEFFKESGVRYIDNRTQSGIIWVPFSYENNKQIEQMLSKYELRYSFERRGSKATGNQPAWRIMAD